MAGVPKSGTSALHHHLTQHPKILGSQPKETYYMLPLKHPLSNTGSNIERQGWEGLLNYFHSERNQSDCLVEGTTHTIYHPEVFEKNGFPEDAHVLFVLRDPIARLRSSFEYTLNNLAAFKKPLAFEEYVDILLTGKTEALDDFIFDSPSLYVLRRDLIYGEYIEFLNKWLKFVPDNRWRVVIYEDFKENPIKVVSNLFEWLQLEPCGITLGDRNKTKAIRLKRVHRSAIALNKRLPKAPWTKKLKKIYFKIQNSTGTSIQINEDCVEKLSAYYAPHKERLENLLGRPLSQWM